MSGGCETESETEQEQSNTPILLPIFKFNPQTTMVDYSSSPERSGTVTPPLCTLASVPFGWEEEPGKPRTTSSSSSSTNDIVTLTNSKSKSKSKTLQLPPRLQQLLLDEGDDDDATKVHSPSSVLEGPYCVSRSNTCHLPPSSRGVNKGMRMKERGWFGSWSGKKVRREVSRGSYVFTSNSTSSADEDYHVNVRDNKVRSVTKMQRSRSISHLFHAKPWTMICESFKQVVPWKSRKLNEVGYGALNL